MDSAKNGRWIIQFKKFIMVRVKNTMLKINLQNGKLLYVIICSFYQTGEKRRHHNEPIYMYVQEN